MSEKEFSLEQSEELIANLKSGAPSEFEQLRSTLSLLAHVPDISPVSLPPILPSSIDQPVPIIPARSSKSRRTIVTSIMVAGLFASASLAAAAVTGIGPAVIVNAGHSAAKFVKDVVGGVTHVVTGNTDTNNLADGNQNQATSPLAPPVLNPSQSVVANNPQSGNESNSEQDPLAIPLLAGLLPPVPTILFPPALTSTNSDENNSQTPISSNQVQGPTVEDVPPATVPNSNENQNQSNSPPSEQPTPEQPSDQPSIDPSATPEPTTQPTDQPTDQPSPDASVPSPEPTDTPSPES